MYKGELFKIIAVHLRNALQQINTKSNVCFVHLGQGKLFPLAQVHIEDGFEINLRNFKLAMQSDFCSSAEKIPGNFGEKGACDSPIGQC